MKSAFRPADKPAGPARVFFFHRFTRGFRAFVLLKSRSGQVCPMHWRVQGGSVSWANRYVGVPSCPAPPSPAALPYAAPPRPARGMSGSWNQQNEFINKKRFDYSKTRIYNGRVGSGRRAAGQRGRTGRRRVGPSRRPPTLLHPTALWTTTLNDSPQARTSEIPFKPMGEHNERLTTVLSAGPRTLFFPGC